VLGTLPLISAPDDFDARLMNAIRTQQRPSAPIPHWSTSDPATINWFTHVTGWIGGVAVAVGLAFFIHSVDNSVRPGTRQAPAPVVSAARSNGPSVAVPSWGAPSSAPQAARQQAPAPVSQEGLAAVQEPAPYSGGNDEHAEAAPEVVVRPQAVPDVVVEPRPLHTQPVQVRPETPAIEDAGTKSVAGQQHSLNSGAVHTPVSQGTITSSHENVEVVPTPAKPDTASAQGTSNSVTTPPSDSEDVSAPGMGGEENVDTGRERIGQDTVRGKQP
jgi:hypothetical protein